MKLLYINIKILEVMKMWEEERNLWENAIKQIRGMQEDLTEDYEKWEEKQKSYPTLNDRAT